MKKEPYIFDVNTLFEIEPTSTLKAGAKYNFDAAGDRKIILDFTDVRLTKKNTEKIQLLAEAIDDYGVGPCKVYDNDNTSKVIKTFRAMRRIIQERTVRIVYGQEFIGRLQEAETTREALEILREEDGGCVKCIRFRTSAEKRAYLMGVDDCFDWMRYDSPGDISKTVEKAISKIQVKEA